MEGVWWSSVPTEELPDDAEFRAELAQTSEPPYGERRQELVIIGHELNETDFRRTLDECLLTDDEFEAGPDVWAGFEDPIPEWELVHEAHDHHHHDHDHHGSNGSTG